MRADGGVLAFPVCKGVTHGLDNRFFTRYGRHEPAGHVLDAQKRSQTINGAAANYLGLSPQDLRTQVEAGKSLGDIATAQGKSVDGLKAALLDALKGAGGAAIANPLALVNRIVSSKGDGDGDAGKVHGHHGHHHGQKPPLPSPVADSQTGTAPDAAGTHLEDHLNPRPLVAARTVLRLLRAGRCPGPFTSFPASRPRSPASQPRAPGPAA